VLRVRAGAEGPRRAEDGAAYGWRRAHKHTDTPGEEAIVDQIVQGVLNEICEYFDFDDEDRSA
jgi:predicted Zn-dependent protease with MMP-like domain